MDIKLRVLGFLVVMGLFLSSSMVFAEGGLWGGKKSNAPEKSSQTIKDLIFQELNLNDQQKKQMEDIRKKEAEAVKPIFELLKSQKQELKKELINPNFDQNKANGIQAQIKTLSGKLEDSHLLTLLEIKKVLTPEQFNKFLNLRIERKQHKADKK